MNRIRARFKAVIISVLLLAIILCSVVLYTMETGRTPTAQAVSAAQAQEMPIVATPVSLENTAQMEPLNRTVELNVDGNTVTVTSHNYTVADYLNIVGIELSEEDDVFPALDTPLSSGANIDVIRTLYKVTEESEEIPYETEYIEDEDMYEGHTEVEQHGYEGVTVNKYKVTLHGGKTASKNLIESTVQYEPQNEIIRYGTKAYEEPEYEEPQYEEPVNEEPVNEEPEVVQETSEETVTPQETEASDTTDVSGANVTFDNDYQRYAYECFPSYGWTDADFEALKQLWWCESHWIPTSRNPYSGAYGIPQALPGDKMAAYGDDWETNGYVQVAWGLDYIKLVYGNPSNAWSTFCSKGWY